MEAAPRFDSHAVWLRSCGSLAPGKGSRHLVLHLLPSTISSAAVPVGLHLFKASPRLASYTRPTLLAALQAALARAPVVIDGVQRRAAAAVQAGRA